MEGAAAFAACFGCGPGSCINPCYFWLRAQLLHRPLPALGVGSAAATVLVACLGREFGGRGRVVKTDTLLTCADACLATMLAVKPDALLACDGE